MLTTSSEWIFLVIVTLATILIVLAIPVLRDLVKGTFGLLLMPAFLEISKTSLGYLIWILKTIYQSHWILLKNLVLPRSLIYRTLERNEEGVVRRQ